MCGRRPCEATAGAILSGLSISKSLTAATASILTDMEFGGGEAEQIDGSTRDLRAQLPDTTLGPISSGRKSRSQPKQSRTERAASCGHTSTAGAPRLPTAGAH